MTVGIKMLSWLLYSKTLNVSEQWQHPLNPAAILLFSEDISESSLLLNLHLLFAAALTTSGDTVVFFSGRGVMKKNNNFCCKVSGLCTFQGRWSGTSVPHFTSIASCGQVPNIDELSKRKKKTVLYPFILYSCYLSNKKPLSLYHFVDFVL